MDKKDESFFNENKKWIFMFILLICIEDMQYFNLFDNLILNSVLNIIFIAMEIVLLCFVFDKCIKSNVNGKFYKFLIIFLVVIGIITSFYRMGDTVGKMLYMIKNV